MRARKYFAVAALAAAATLAAPLAAMAATPHKQGIVADHGVVKVDRRGEIRPMNVTPVTLYDEDGTAGWYTQAFDTDFYRVNGTGSLNPDNTASLILPFAGAGGVQLCNSGDGNVVQEGEVESSPGSHTYTIGYTLGTFVSGGIGGDLCEGNNFFDFGPVTVSDEDFTALASIPVGDSVQYGVQESNTNSGGCTTNALSGNSHSHTAVQFNAADISNGIEIANYQSPWECLPANVDFNEAGGGQTTNLSLLGGPVADDLIDFSGVTTCSLYGHACGGFARWTATDVASSGNGQPPALLEATALTPSVFARTCVINKKGHKVCTTTGGGPSSFSIMGAVPIGL